MDEILATVVTAVRNGERFLGRAIVSIQAQTFRDWEYIIVDDASEDGTVDIIESVVRDDPRVRLVRREATGGPYAAANEGIRHARGRYIFRLDSDDVAAPNRIAHQLEFMAGHPSVRACAAGGGLISRPDSMIGKTRMLPTTPGAVRWHLCVRRNLRHSSACIERSALDAMGGYRELAAAQDFRMWCDLARRCWVGVTPEVLVYSQTHADSLTRTNPSRQRELAIDVLAEHVEAITGERWGARDVATLWELQRTSAATPVSDGLRVLRRWDRAWRSDDTLTPADRAHLTRLRRSLIVRLFVTRRAIAAAYGRITARSR